MNNLEKIVLDLRERLNDLSFDELYELYERFFSEPCQFDWMRT